MTSNTQLQERFLQLVSDMRAADVELPPSFRLHYHVRVHHDRCGTAISVKPYLSELAARQSLEEPDQVGGTHWVDATSHYVNSKHRVHLDDFVSPDDHVLYEFDFRIPEAQRINRDDDDGLLTELI